VRVRIMRHWYMYLSILASMLRSRRARSFSPVSLMVPVGSLAFSRRLMRTTISTVVSKAASTFTTFDAAQQITITYTSNRHMMYMHHLEL
jgi:hypothetical protein